jgi:hypothetical protein
VSESRDEIAVHLDAADFGPVSEIGRLRRARRGATAVVSFSFTADWLRLPHRLALDPSLGVYEGEQYAADAER